MRWVDQELVLFIVLLTVFNSCMPWPLYIRDDFRLGHGTFFLSTYTVVFSLVNRIRSQPIIDGLALSVGQSSKDTVLVAYRYAFGIMNLAVSGRKASYKLYAAAQLAYTATGRSPIIAFSFLRAKKMRLFTVPIGMFK